MKKGLLGLETHVIDNGDNTRVVKRLSTIRLVLDKDEKDNINEFKRQISSPEGWGRHMRSL